MRGKPSTQILCCTCNGPPGKCKGCRCAKAQTKCLNCRTPNCDNRRHGSPNGALGPTMSVMAHPTTQHDTSLPRMVHAPSLGDTVNSSFPVDRFSPGPSPHEIENERGDCLNQRRRKIFETTIHWRPNLYSLPKCNASNEFILILSRLFDCACKGEDVSGLPLINAFCCVQLFYKSRAPVKSQQSGGNSKGGYHNGNLWS